MSRLGLIQRFHHHSNLSHSQTQQAVSFSISECCFGMLSDNIEPVDPFCRGKVTE